MVFDYGGYNMKSIKDFKRKYETLWLFFKGIPQMAIGIGINKEKQVFVYDTPPYKFRDNYRKEFDAILSQAEDYYLSCMVDEIELEDEIIRNIDLIPLIKKSIKDGGYCEYPKVEPRNFPWLKSLLEAQIISDLEFNLACNHIRYCSETMESNVQKLCKLLKRHGNVTAQPKVEEQQPNTKPSKRSKKEHCFRDIVQYNDKDALMNRLHQLIDGKGGADVGAILLQAKIDGFLMRVPNRAEFENEFGKLTDDENSKAKSKWEAIRKYLDDEEDIAINKCSSMNIRIFEP